MTEFYDVAVIGGGPSGMAAALEAEKTGAKTLLIEREGELGGILKQCIHDGFGLISLGKLMAGPEYAQHYIDKIELSGVETALRSFVSKIEKSSDGFILKLISSEGIREISAKSIIFACGCRERTGVQVQLHGDRPAGIYTAGAAQHYVNILGMLPGKRCVILGSGDIGLIMARRLTLEGAEVLGVYEAKSEPGGLRRNINSCLKDFDIPLYLNHSVTRAIGRNRLEAVEVAELNENMEPIEGSEKIIDCDCLILSVGLIPENELAESLGLKLNKDTMGPSCDQNCMCNIDGVFSCGNCQNVKDLVDYVSMSGEIAGKAGADYALGCLKGRKLVKIQKNENFSALVPQMLNINSDIKNVEFYFRSAKSIKNARLSVNLDGKEVYTVNYKMLRPPEMKLLKLDFSGLDIRNDSEISMEIREVSGLE